MSTSIANLSAVITQQTQAAKYPHAVAFCVDNKYLPYALFVAEQLLALQEKTYDICVCLPDLTQVPAPFLTKDIRFVEMQVLGIEKLPVGKLSLAAYNRLFLPQIFANDYHYIVYLDADTFINRAFFADLMTVVADFDPDFCIAAAVDITEVIRKIEPNKKTFKTKIRYLQYYYQHGHFYRNSGVLVFHTKNCVQQDLGNAILQYAFANIAALRHHDQSALNRVLMQKLARLPFVFNWQLHQLTAPLTAEIQPYIIHFIGENKPWALDNTYTQPYIADYQRFLSAYFPDLAHPPMTKHAQRLHNPKYTHPVREKISLLGQHFRNTLNPQDDSTPTPADIAKVTALLLSQPPF